MKSLAIDLLNARRSRDLVNAMVIPKLPDHRDSATNGDAYPDDLIGATILRFGAAPPECDLEGGGLIIDYMPRDNTEAKRAVFAFNELGMWRET